MSEELYYLKRFFFNVFESFFIIFNCFACNILTWVVFKFKFLTYCLYFEIEISVIFF